jgi:hypothetical protein
LILLVDAQVDNWILSISFLRNYYAIFDVETNSLGLAPHKTSNAQIILNAVKPTTELNYVDKSGAAKTPVYDQPFSIIDVIGMNLLFGTLASLFMFAVTSTFFGVD